MEAQNIYEKGFSSPEEIERLKNLDFPFYVSTELLRDDLRDKKVADIGSGPNPSLGRWIEEQGGDYLAFDINKTFLENIKKAELDATIADCRHLPLEDNSVDIVHLRFVLMHFSAKDRSSIIREALRVTRKEVLILDYDWGDFKAEGEINEVKNIALELLTQISDPFYGAKLKSEIEKANLKSIFKDFTRPRLAYLSELKKMVQALIGLSQKVDPTKTKQLQELQTKIEALNEKDESVTFIPPSIKTAKINK